MFQITPFIPKGQNKENGVTAIAFCGISRSQGNKDMIAYVVHFFHDGHIEIMKVPEIVADIFNLR